MPRCLSLFVSTGHQVLKPVARPGHGEDPYLPLLLVEAVVHRDDRLADDPVPRVDAEADEVALAVPLPGEFVDSCLLYTSDAADE